jgi:hypothetical protein
MKHLLWFEGWQAMSWRQKGELEQDRFLIEAFRFDHGT